MSTGARIVVTGYLAQYPLGGVAWDYVQYVVGLHRLGHDVYYIEDTGQWPFNPLEGGTSEGCEFNVAYLNVLLGRFGLQDRWAYRFPWKDQWFGMPDARRREVIKTADILLNVSGSLADPSAYRAIRRLAYLDTDPVFTQIKLARGQQHLQQAVDLHDVHFTFGETLSDVVPATGHTWRATRQPVLLDTWTPEAEPPRRTLTTILNWTSYKPVTWEGREYGQKDVELERFMDLPRRSRGVAFELAINAGKTKRTPYERLRSHGWELADPNSVCPDLESYRRYIQGSLGEWSVAKGAYVAGRSGWFSCRSACYLAAGRPVVVQDTGFSDVLPTGMGLISFSTLEEAVTGVDSLLQDYEAHSEAAREVARSSFAAESVLPDLVARIFNAGEGGTTCPSIPPRPMGS